MERQRPSTHQVPFQPSTVSRLTNGLNIDDINSKMRSIRLNEEIRLQDSTRTYAPTRNFVQKLPFVRPSMEEDANVPLLLSDDPRVLDSSFDNSVLAPTALSRKSEHYAPHPSKNLPPPPATSRVAAQRPSSATAIAHQPRKSFKPLLLTRAGTDSRFPKSRAEHPFAKGFEVPQWRKLAVHLSLCAFGYPFLLLFVYASRQRSFFWSRTMVGVGCGLLGGLLGWSLMRIAERILEASVWATIIHQSRLPDSRTSGVRLKDLAIHSNSSTSSIAAFRLLWDRYSYLGTERAYRSFYDSRKWSFWIFFFILNAVIGATLPFVMARLIDIGIVSVLQHEIYSEVAVNADISSADIQRAQSLVNVVQDPELAWTLQPLSLRNKIPGTAYFIWNNDIVYFAEVTKSQLVGGGFGSGPFETNTTVPSSKTNDATESLTTTVRPGSILRFPRWGLRTKCANIPDLPNNIFVSTSNLTYLFTPRDTLRNIFTGFGMDLPADFEVPINLTGLMDASDISRLSDGLNQQEIAMSEVFLDDGAGYSLRSTPLNLGDLGNGFISLETAVIRLNTTFTPHGFFPIISSIPVLDAHGFETFLGYDATVCLQLYEPWIVEVYNCTVAPPISMRIVDKAAVMADMADSEVGALQETRVGSPLIDKSVRTAALNSTGLAPVWMVAHQNSVNFYAKDNVRSGRYLPTPTIVSFTSSSGPLAYTSLLPSSYAHARSIADASMVLPYLVGSAPRLARRYSDSLLTTTSVHTLGMACLLVGICLLGVVSALWVPRLPLDIPRRDTGVFSWFAAFGFLAGGEQGELTLIDDFAERGLRKGMDLEDLEDILGEERVRWTSG